MSSPWYNVVFLCVGCNEQSDTLRDGRCPKCKADVVALHESSAAVVAGLIRTAQAETERLQAEVEALREAWAEVREVAVACIEGDPYGNEAATLILDNMDATIPELAGEALAPPPAAPAPKPPPVAPPSPAPAPPLWRWEKEEAYRDGAWRVRGTLTHLPSGIADTSGWWLDSGDAHAEAEQGIRNKLARSGK